VEELDRDVRLEGDVPSAPHLAGAARTEQRLELVPPSDERHDRRPFVPPSHAVILCLSCRGRDQKRASIANGVPDSAVLASSARTTCSLCSLAEARGACSRWRARPHRPAGKLPRENASQGPSIDSAEEEEVERLEGRLRFRKGVRARARTL
jgi:hypothetical protein